MRRVLLVLAALLAVLAVAGCGASKPAPKRYGSGCGPILLHRYGCAPTPSGPPVNSTAPLVTSSTAQVAGNAVTASTGTWTGSPNSYTYQWQDCVQSNLTGQQCSDISGATSTTYTLQTSDVGNTVQVRVTATNSGGSRSAASIQTGMVGCSTCRTYYISYTNGNDTNSGTSTASPWKLAPGMQGFCLGQSSGGCFSYCPAAASGGGYTCSGEQAGDRFILEGGDTWPNSVFPDVIYPGGSSGKPIYEGVETDWHVGSSFTRPIFDAANSNISGWDGGTNGAHDVMVEMGATDWIDLDDVELTGFRASGTSLLSCGIVTAGGSGASQDQNIIVNRIYEHNFYVDDNSAQCGGVAGGTNYPYEGNSVLENSTIAGDSLSYLAGARNWGNILNSTISGMEWIDLPNGHGTIAGNHFFDCGWNGTQTQWPTEGAAGGGHSDLLQINGSDGNLGGSGIYYIYDNVLHDTGTGSDSTGGNGECELALINNPGETDYFFNNVVYNVRGNPGPTGPQNITTGPGVGFYVWNNSIEGGGSDTRACIGFASGVSIHYDFQNNLCVTGTGDAGNPGGGVDIPGTSCSSGPCPVNNNVAITPPSQASADGYAMQSGALVWLPPAGSSPTDATGINLTSECTGALLPLCSDTNYLGQRTAVSRPSSGAWDVGAYEVP